MAVGRSIKVVSMHRPSKEVLSANLSFDDVINSYGFPFFNDFKYLSDSRRTWREPVEEIIRNCKYDRLHILTHPFWYNNYEFNIHDTVKCFVNSACLDRYRLLSDNITDLQSIMKDDEIKRI